MRLFRLVQSRYGHGLPHRAVLAAAFLSILAALFVTRSNPPLGAATAGTIHYPDFQTVIPTGNISIVRPTPSTREFRYTHHMANLGDGPVEVRMQYDPATDTARPFQRLYTHNAAG